MLSYVIKYALVPKNDCLHVYVATNPSRLFIALHLFVSSTIKNIRLLIGLLILINKLTCADYLSIDLIVNLKSDNLII